jgi:hypothetical protein
MVLSLLRYIIFQQMVLRILSKKPSYGYRKWGAV